MNPSDTVLPSRVEVPDAARPGAGLSAPLRDATRALVETLFASEAGPPSADRVDWLIDDLDDFMARSGGRARGLYRLCVFAITWLAPLHIKRFSAFHGLDFATRAEALERMERGPFGMAVFGAKTLVSVLWFEHPANERAAGNTGGCLGGGR